MRTYERVMQPLDWSMEFGKVGKAVVACAVIELPMVRKDVKVLFGPPSAGNCAFFDARVDYWQFYDRDSDEYVMIACYPDEIWPTVFASSSEICKDFFAHVEEGLDAIGFTEFRSYSPEQVE